MNGMSLTYHTGRAILIRAEVLGVPKPPPQLQGQVDLFTELETT
jgi:hypothetical protein